MDGAGCADDDGLGVGMLEALRNRYVDAQLSGDRREALRIVLEDGVARGFTVRELQLDVIAGAQRAIGELWQADRISVADEHQATAISQLVLSHLYSHIERGATRGKRVLVACVDGELHDMPARIAADLLEADGFDVAFLGASVPAPSLASRVRRERPDVVALSVTMSFHLVAARAALVALRSFDVPVVVGGDAVRDLDVATLGERAVASGGSGADLVGRMRTLVRAA